MASEVCMGIIIWSEYFILIKWLITQATIAGLLPWWYLLNLVKTLQFILRLGIHRWNLQVPDLQMNHYSFTTCYGSSLVGFKDSRIKKLFIRINMHEMRGIFFFSTWLQFKVMPQCTRIRLALTQSCLHQPVSHPALAHDGLPTGRYT